MSNIITDGDWSTARAVSAPVKSPVFEGDNTDYILEQEYEQTLSTFSRLALNIPHPDFPDFYLVNESELTPIGTGLVHWTRTYAKIPPSRSEPGGTYAYTFPGFYGVIPGYQGALAPSITVTGRAPITLPVPARLAIDYYLVGAGGTYATFILIPIIQAQAYYIAANNSLIVEYLSDAPPFSVASDPSRTAYDALVAAGTELVVEASTVTRWRGNIFERVTKYVVAR